MRQEKTTPIMQEFQAFSEGYGLFEKYAAAGERMLPIHRRNLNETALLAQGWTEARILAAILGWNTAYQYWEGFLHAS